MKAHLKGKYGVTPFFKNYRREEKPMYNTLKDYMDNKSTTDTQALQTKSIVVSIFVAFNFMISAVLFTLWVAWLFLESTFLPALAFVVIFGLYVYCYNFKTQYFYVLSWVFATISLVAALALFVTNASNSGFTLLAIASQMLSIFGILLTMIEIYHKRLTEHLGRVLEW
ncbi:MAG: hypothetical protein L3J24_06215 [Xanthomonadales bacterium]|nr:hypothetical protein [Xanthomonadales bacterium]